MMSDYSKKFIVKPGSKIRLKHFDAGYHGNVSPTNALCRKFNSTSRRWRNCNTSCTPNGRTRCSLCFRASTLRAKTEPLRLGGYIWRRKAQVPYSSSFYACRHEKVRTG